MSESYEQNYNLPMHLSMNLGICKTISVYVSDELNTITLPSIELEGTGPH